MDYREQNRIANALVDYLLLWSDSSWIDEEKLYLLGKDVRLACPPQFQNKLAEVLQDKARSRATGVFLAGFNQLSLDRDNIKSLPSISQLNKLITRLTNDPAQELEGELDALIQKYVAYTEYLGDPGPLVRAIIRINSVLIRTRGPLRPWAARLGRRLADEGVRWAPNNARLWLLWAASLTQAGVFEAAELLYWDGIRRFPWHWQFRTRLIQVLRRRRSRLGEALMLARESLRLFPGSTPVAFQLAITLGQTKDTDNISEGVRILLDLQDLRHATGSKHGLTSTLASIIASADRDGLLKNDDLDIIVYRLRNTPSLLGGISYRLIHDHKSFTLAQRIWEKRVQLAPDDDISRNQLVTAYATSGKKEDLAKAFSLLWVAIYEFPKSAGIRNHLAKLLAKEGRPGDRSQAIDLLRQTIILFPKNVYALVQLAEVFASSGDTHERGEAISLLREALTIDPKNAEVSNFLELILRSPEGQPVFMTEPLEHNRSEDEDDLTLIEELPTEPTKLISPVVAKWGAARKLRFTLENGSESERSASLEQIKYILEHDSFIYAELLAERQGLLNDADQPTTFSLAFERALRKRDQSALETLSGRFPRMAALTIVACAVLGDKTAVSKIENLFSTEDAMLHPVALALKRRMTPHLQLIRGGRSAEAVITENRVEILSALHDATEAALYEPAFAA